MRFKEMVLLLDYYSEHRNLFKEDRIIDSCYDFPTGLIWNGGRPFNLRDWDMMQCREIIQYYRYRNLELRHTCTNSLLTPVMCLDHYCNLFFKDCVESTDKIIINNKHLKNYIEAKYPKLKFIYSTTLGITDLQQINEITKDNMYVLHYKYNTDDNYISQLKNPENIEFLCAETCIPNCPLRAIHYRSFSKIQLGLPLEDEEFFACPYDTDYTPFNKTISQPHAINNNRVDELAEKGFQYFKIGGRGLHPIKWLETIIYYLAKDEYRDDIRQYLTAKWCGQYTY